MPLRAPDTHKVTTGLIVKPRFGWDGIGPLLQHIGWEATPRILEMQLVPGSAREVPAWVLAGPILRRLERLLQDMRRSFHVQEEVRQTPRGQILWQRYITNHVVHGALHQLPCRYPDLAYDRLLRAYLRWGFERVYHSLIPYATLDVIARQLAEQAQALILQVQDTTPRVPDRRTLQQILQGVGLPSCYILRNGLQALGWIVDERGLAGEADIDGLAWTLPMHELFERWVGHLVSHWAKTIGGDARAGYRGQTNVPIDWSRRSVDALSSLYLTLLCDLAIEFLSSMQNTKVTLKSLTNNAGLSCATNCTQSIDNDVHRSPRICGTVWSERDFGSVDLPDALASMGEASTSESNNYLRVFDSSGKTARSQVDWRADSVVANCHA